MRALVPVGRPCEAGKRLMLAHAPLTGHEISYIPPDTEREIDRATLLKNEDY
jgi:hypothetical protein